MHRFASPWFLTLLLFVFPLIWIYILRERRRFRKVAITDPASVVSSSGYSLKPLFRHVTSLLPICSLALLAVALARPQSISEGEDTYSEGIDVVIAMDISASMQAQDLKPDRVGAAKAVAAEFIDSRPNDRIGMVLFAKSAFTQCPLTIDHDILLELVDGVKIGLADPDKTAIGHALATSLNRMKDSESKSKIIILLTDGENNSGLPPTTSAEAAEALGVRIYTIGIGTRGQAPYPTTDIFGRPSVQMVIVSIDEPLLQDIAEATGGRYFRATNNSTLREIFNEIDQMERTRIEVRAYRRYGELFYPWAWAALILLMLSSISTLTITRSMA